MNEACETINLNNVLIQENGIIRAEDGYLIGRLCNELNIKSKELQFESNNNIINAISVLKKAMNKKDGYYESWIANIAMAFIDNYRWYKEKNGKKYMNSDDIHKIANNAAEYFLKQLFKG